MFRLRLHPTPVGFAFGLFVIAVWALLWVWFLAQLVQPHASASRSAAAAPEITFVARDVTKTA